MSSAGNRFQTNKSNGFVFKNVAITSHYLMVELSPYYGRIDWVSFQEM